MFGFASNPFRTDLLKAKRSNPRDAREIIYTPRGDAALYFKGRPG